VGGKPGDPDRPIASGPEVLEGGGGTHVEIYRNLAAAISGGRPLVAPGDEGVAAVELANAITFSSATGNEVSLPLDRVAYAAFLGRLRTSPPVDVSTEVH
jgi:predicted dehydrogenase